MALAVVNYPSLSEEDYNWIQSVRQAYDSLYFDLIDPHIPLVFPTDGIQEAVLIDHVQRQVRHTSSFEVVFRCTLLGDPDFQDHAHAFLVPDEGFSEVVRLHDRLYTGPLTGELRLDLPFLPHLGIANASDPASCKEIVDRLNEEPFEIRGQVSQLDVIGFDGERIWSIEQIPLPNS